MKTKTTDIKVVHDMVHQVLLDWLDTPPTERREVQALQLLAEANQMLYAACINLGVAEIKPK
ncbi:MAG: hypothetical protein ACXV7J_10440 [Methylomonas sp.]